MKVIPNFKPAISYKQLNRVLLGVLFGDVSDEEIILFEHKFARYLGVKHAIRVPSGRWALYYILDSLDLREGDEVILPAFTYFAVPAAIIKLRLKPIFVDINPRNLNINVQKIKENITKRTKVIIPTHLCGFVYELEEILDIAQQNDIKVVEDCAQSLGAEYKGKKVGSFGEASYFTFGITKNFTTLGGGIIATNNDELAHKVREKISAIRQTNNCALFFKLLKAYIMKFAVSPILFPAVYIAMRIFSNFNVDIVDFIFQEKESMLGNLPKGGLLSNIQAELAMAQLNDLDINNDKRKKRGEEFYRILKDIEYIHIPLPEKNAKNIFSTCPILVKNKKDMRRILLRKGIDTSSGYMQNCSSLDIFKEFRKDCPNASRVEDEVLYIPLYAELTHSELMYIKEVLEQIVE